MILSPGTKTQHQSERLAILLKQHGLRMSHCFRTKCPAPTSSKLETIPNSSFQIKADRCYRLTSPRQSLETYVPTLLRRGSMTLIALLCGSCHWQHSHKPSLSSRSSRLLNEQYITICTFWLTDTSRIRPETFSLDSSILHGQTLSTFFFLTARL